MNETLQTPDAISKRLRYKTTPNYNFMYVKAYKYRSERTNIFAIVQCVRVGMWREQICVPYCGRASGVKGCPLSDSTITFYGVVKMWCMAPSAWINSAVNCIGIGRWGLHKRTSLAPRRVPKKISYVIRSMVCVTIFFFSVIIRFSFCCVIWNLRWMKEVCCRNEMNSFATVENSYDFAMFVRS